MTNIDLKTEFPLQTNLCHLNHAAVGPWPYRTMLAIKQFAEENCNQGSLSYKRWMGKELYLRKQLQTLLNAQSTQEIALLKNTSEALSIVAYGLDWQVGNNIVIPAEEFPSNRIVWQSLTDKYGVEVRLAHFSTNETPEESIVKLTDHNTKLISVSSVQYATGLVIDLQKLGLYCNKKNIFFCVDAIQSLCALPIDVQQISADFVMADGHKWMLAPEGLAVFYCKAQHLEKLKLYQYGWHMTQDSGNYTTQHWQVAESARRFECGSPNMLGIHALSASLSLFEEVGLEKVKQCILDNTEYLFAQLSKLPEIELLTETTKGRYAGIVNFRLREGNQDKLFNFLTKQRVICAQRGDGIRFSPHFYTRKEKLDQAIGYLKSYIK
ncbi:MAG: aminotransferase class V-fold PLP-dependent enzyme [Gammaproteobacteria bacterium]|nr:aminotransferase class V-fold PLP-dependent enzyme [Gammaproteobacteria bacterium]